MRLADHLDGPRGGLQRLAGGRLALAGAGLRLISSRLPSAGEPAGAGGTTGATAPAAGPGGFGASAGGGALRPGRRP